VGLVLLVFLYAFPTMAFLIPTQDSTVFLKFGKHNPAQTNLHGTGTIQDSIHHDHCIDSSTYFLQLCYTQGQINHLNNKGTSLQAPLRCTTPLGQKDPGDQFPQDWNLYQLEICLAGNAAPLVCHVAMGVFLLMHPLLPVFVHM
jgi:hypothetical protein